MLEIYQQIFWEGFLTAILIPFKGYFGLVASNSFEYNTVTITSLTIAGAMFGHFMNYLIGLGFYKIVMQHTITGWSNERHKDLSLITEHYKIYLVILLAGVSFFGGLTTIFAGFARVKLVLFIPLCFASLIASCMIVVIFI